MKLTRIAQLGAVAAIAALTLTACASNEGTTSPSGSGEASTLSGSIAGSGASSQGKAQDTWIANFSTTNPRVTIAYDGGGSGAGRTAFISGGVDFAGSDRAFKDDELTSNTFATCAADSGIVELPLYISPIAIGFKLDGIESLNLDSATIAKIFSGQITTWNDPAIASLNPGVTLPSLAVTPIHRSTNSGTTENFTDYLAKTAPEVWKWPASGDWPSDITGGEGAAETSDVASLLSSANGSIGYLDASRAPGSTVAIKVGDEFVAYSPEGAAAVVESSPLVEGREPFDLAIQLDRTTTDPTHYPLVLVSYLIGCETYATAGQAELVKAYFSYIASAEGQDAAAAEAGNAPISDALREQIVAAIDVIS